MRQLMVVLVVRSLGVRGSEIVNTLPQHNLRLCSSLSLSLACSTMKTLHLL